MHDGRLSEVEVTKDGEGIVVNVRPAQYVGYRVAVIYSDGRPPDLLQGSG
jgi:hypothetical protein